MNRHAALSPPPIPRAWGHVPLLGHLPALHWDLPRVMRSMAGGSERLWRLDMAPQWEARVWASPESVELFKNKVTSSAHVTAISDVVTGQRSMLSADGEAHRRRRRTANPVFTPKGLSMSGVSAIIREVVEPAVEALLQRPRARVLAVTQVVALDIIFRVLGVPPEELPEWARRYTTMIRGALGPRWDFPGSPHRRALAARAWVDARLAAHVGRVRRDPAATGLIAELVRGRDEDGGGPDDEALFDDVRLMILAGHETTASIIAWMVSYAATRPELQERLIVEARAAEGLPETPKQLHDHAFTEAVFREVLRLHPPVTLATRVLLEPMSIEGRLLAPGEVVGVPIWLLNRDPAVYPEPERFLPERWLGRDRRFTPLETVPFGGGPHFCLGAHMALVEAVQFMVALMRGLDRRGLRLHMKALPRESAVPLLRPRMSDTDCALRPVA